MNVSPAGILLAGMELGIVEGIWDPKNGAILSARMFS
jgi:hypothetical protein